MSIEEELKKEIKANLIDLIQHSEGISEQRRTAILAALKHPATQVNLNLKEIKTFLELVFLGQSLDNRPSKQRRTSR